MSLQHLVEYFNERFEQEASGSRLASQNNGFVTGSLGGVNVGSLITPVRQTFNYHTIPAYIAQIALMDPQFMPIQAVETGQLLADAARHNAEAASIVNLDRLCRIVHILNYLTATPSNRVLFLDVDPRHILGVDRNHGVYFEEAILKCGLAVNNIAIAMIVNDFYAPYHNQIIHGLRNYRQRGYQLALNIGLRYGTKNLPQLITELAPDYLCINAPDERYADNIIGLNLLKNLAEMVNGKAFLQHIGRQAQFEWAEKLGFELVHGEYCEQLAADALRCA